MISKFSCHNFRNIQADNLEFEQTNILIGPNNSGKSNFIKAITFFSDMLRNEQQDGNLKSSFLNALSRNGWGHILNKQAQSSTPIEFSWDIDLYGKPVSYKFAFTVGDSLQDCNITLEELNDTSKSENYTQQFNFFRCHDEKIGMGKFSTAVEKGHKNKRIQFHVNEKETIVSQFKDILLANKNIYVNDYVRTDIAPLLYDLRKYFEGFSVYTSAKFNTEKMRQPVAIKSVDDYLSSDISNFVNVFNFYKSTDLRWQSLFEENMKELIPTLEKADSVVAYDKMIFKMIYNDLQYALSDVSEGTLKGLVLNMLINMPMRQEQSLLAIDEPETNLHPAWQKVIGLWLQRSKIVKQCFISTHSPDFLDTFTDGFKHGNVAVFVFSEYHGIRKITYEDIKDDLDEWELGDLYRTNDPALGGWPW